MSLEACLPADLRGPTTTITRIAAGLSGAGVYRVEAAGQAFVLKISDETQPLADSWAIRSSFGITWRSSISNRYHRGRILPLGFPAPGAAALTMQPPVASRR